MKELGVRFCRRILEQALQSKDDVQAKYYFPQIQLLSAFLQKVLTPPGQEHLQIISGNCKFMFADTIICFALLLSLDSNNKKRKMVQGDKFLDKFSRLFDLACGRYREEAEAKPLYSQENTGAPMMSVNTHGVVNVDVKISARQGVTLFANGQEICLVKQCLRHLETEVVIIELSNKTLVQNEVFLIAEVTLKLMENIKTRHYTEIVLSEDYILKLAAAMNFSVCDVLPELKETLQSIVKLWFQETIGNSGADSTINLTLSKMMGNEQLITSYVMEQIYETILKTGEKQQNHLKKFSELLVQIIINSKAKVTDELLMIAHEEIDAGTWQKIGAPAKSALLNLINLEKVSISSKLANVFILAGFTAEESDKISPTAELLLSSANFISAKISAQELVNLLANGSETVDQEAVVHVLEQILSMNVGVGDFGKLELVKDRLFVAHEKCQSGSRKKVLLSGLINLGLIDRDLVEKSEAKVFDKLLDKLATEADLNILTHFGEQLESSLKHVGLDSQRIIYEKIREVCYGKSKIREKQAMIWLSFCDFLPNILSPVQAITLYTKFLYQDGVLEERAILALTAFESMQFKEQLMSQLRCMTLPKESAQASIVLFLRDIIGFCESSDCITDFLNILKSSRVDSKKTEYQLPNQIIGKMILLTLDSTQNVSSRAKRIMKNCTEKETVDKIVLDQAFLDEALERIWSSDSRHRYYCVEGVYLHLDRKMAKASRESTTVIKLIKIAQIAKIWEYVLKITDDIQDKPRLAAIRLVKAGGSPLDKITQLIANETVTNHYGLKEQSETCLSELLKKLVFTLQTTKSGLTRSVCLMSMHSISQKNPSSLKLHAIELIKLLLESASGLESPKIQQISAQVEQFGTGELQNQLNEIKISSFYDSEMNEMLDACINLCDDESYMTPLQKDIVGIISSGIGVTTKCMAILSIPKLVPVIEKIGLDKNIPYYNGKFMAAMFKSLEDSQEAIYRRVIGSIVSVLRSSATKQSTVENVTQKIVKNYFEEKKSSNGPQLAKLCLALPQNILTGKPLSLCFLAQHAVCGEDEDLDAHRALVKLWTSAWKDNTPSELTALKTNRTFIIELCEEALTGEKWSMKQIGAKSLHTLIESLAEDCSFEDVAEKVKQVLIKSIKGTFWKGKKYSCAALIEMMVRNEKLYYCEESLKLVGAQLCSISADSDHKEGVKILVKKVIVAKFWGKMSSELRKQFSKFAEDDSDMVEFFDTQMV